MSTRAQFGGMLFGLAVASALATALPAHAAPRKGSHKMVFIFLELDQGSGDRDQATLERWQAEHIGNFRKRYAEGVLKLAGPLSDPDRKARGIVVLDIASADDVARHFVEDPYIQHRVMKPVAIEGEMAAMALGTPEETGIDQHSIAIFTAAPGKERRKADPSGYLKLPAADRPAVAFRATKPGAVRQILIFREKELDQVRAIVEADPAVQRGDLKAAVWSQWLGKGSLAPP
ncbi:MAG: hypothetical protein NT029_07105 [Armatimonadetes bacterium]|nr:hypothetical protein [Armatimonadota bacterium]